MKWADYAITGVKHSNYSHGAIIEVEARRDNGDSLGPAVRVARAEVVNAILLRGVTFVTAYLQGGTWMRGADVSVVELHGQYFLRTDRDRIRSDNLGELPEAA